MKSREAAELAASLPSSSEQGWNSMNTKTILDTENSKQKSRTSKSIQESTSLTHSKKKSHRSQIDSDSDDDSDDDDDDYIDRPLDELRQHPAIRFLLKQGGMIFKKLYGDSVPASEIRRVLMLSSTLFFMIGGYWMLRSLKDPVLTAICGVSVIPKAKMLSVPVVLLVVSIYNKLLDSNLPKHQLFFVFGSVYFVLFSYIAYCLRDPVMGLPNQQPSPARLLGWVTYCSIESFGSVMVSLFWSFVNSNVSLECAKASYGFIVATAQIGSIIGPTIVNVYAESLGVPTLFFMGACTQIFLQLTMYAFIRIYGVVTPKTDTQTPTKKKAGILEGIYLFWEYRYIKGIFLISCFFMVEVTIVDFTMKVLAKDHFSALYPCQFGDSCWDIITNTATGMSDDATAAFATFMGMFGQATNTLSFLMSLLGTSAVIRTLGLRLTLLLFPSLCFGVILMVRLYPTLWIVFAAMILLKGFSYSLNNPTKEILYQPTSSSVKYKAKSWIDIFGARGSKALGSVVTNAFSDSAANLVQNGSLVGMAVAAYLIYNAKYMGKKFDEYIATGHIVGEEEEKNIQNTLLEMAESQNDDEDTSCAIFEEKEEEENAGSDEEQPQQDSGKK